MEANAVGPSSVVHFQHDTDNEILRLISKSAPPKIGN